MIKNIKELKNEFVACRMPRQAVDDLDKLAEVADCSRSEMLRRLVPVVGAKRQSAGEKDEC